jgi:hypothetical protein
VTGYEIRVGGHLDGHWSERLGGLGVHHDGDGTSTLTGQLADQAQLHGVLAALRDLGVTLLELRSLPVSATPSTADEVRPGTG